MVVTLLVSWNVFHQGGGQLLDRASTSDACDGEFAGTPFSEHNCLCSSSVVRCAVALGATPFEEFPATGKVYENVTRL